MHSVCIVKPQVTVSSLEILSVVQQCWYGKFMLLATINVRRSTCKVPAAVLKQKDVHLLMAFFRGNGRFSVFVTAVLQYSVIQKDGLNFVRLYFLNYT